MQEVVQIEVQQDPQKRNGHQEPLAIGGATPLQALGDCFGGPAAQSENRISQDTIKQAHAV
jgi:hypothetical protein